MPERFRQVVALRRQLRSSPATGEPVRVFLPQQWDEAARARREAYRDRARAAARRSLDRLLSEMGSEP